MTTIHFSQVYVTSRATSVGPLEKQGPLHAYFDVTHEDTYCGCATFEKAERQLVREASDCAMRKAKLHVDAIDIVIGSDLINQLTSSHYFAKDVALPFIGMYGACANASLVIGQAAIWVEHNMARHALAFTSSHVASAERQFRYPNEYGIQKKETTTTTVTGAGAIILGNTPSAIQVSSFSVGRIIDWGHMDANDMGKAMAPAALDTILTNFKDTNRSFADYDFIVTGDLSSIGVAFLGDMLAQEGYPTYDRLLDCGLLIYDVHHQNVFCGGSGCACSMCVLLSKLFAMLENNECQRIMLVATGALLSPVAVQQKESIPCIAHAIVYERGDVL